MAAAGPADVGLECILGRCDSLRAEVYVRASPPPEAAGATIAGTLAGPDCGRGITLPVTARLAPVPGDAPAASVVARTILTEPSYWTPELPHLYRLEARLVASGREIAAWRRTVGLRRLGVRGRSLWLDGRRYVPRGLVRPAAAVAVDGFREAALAAVVNDPPESLLDRCDAEGVPVIAILADTAGRPLATAEAAERLARWAWHAAVLAAVVPRDAAPGDTSASRTRTGTLLVGREVDGTLPPAASAPEGDLLVVVLPPDGLPHPSWRTAAPAVPMLVRRTEGGAAVDAKAAPSRRPCDVLQAAVAGWMAAAAGPPPWDWAGYLAG